MKTIQEALRIIQAHQPEREKEWIPLDEALQRILAEDIPAPEPSPRYTNSAMDGFAVRWQDVEAAASGQTVELAIVGESQAGEPFVGTVGSGQAVRINTGAMLPDGADTVVPIEEVDEKDQRIVVRKIGRKHQHVRFRGEEFERGKIVLNCGDSLTPARLGLLASLGIHTVPVFRQARVGIVVTGTELVPLEADIQPWQIRDSNGIMLMAAVLNSGGKVVFSERTGDQLQEIKRLIQKAKENTDIIIFSGGVSVGPHDLVKQAAQEEGFEPLFWGVRQKPGKPLFVAHQAGSLFFGLPGNPVSALNCYTYYVHPIIQKMGGREFSWQIRQGLLAGPVRNAGSRVNFLRVRTEKKASGGILVHPLDKQNSHMLTSIARADGFILLQPDSSHKEGETVEVFLYPWRT